jgi:ferredoxin
VNQQAREAALAAALDVAIEPTSLIAFQSGGRLLLIGAAQQALSVAQRLCTDDAPLACCVLATEGHAEPQDAIPLIYSHGRALALSGHLGEFTVTLVTDQGAINLAQIFDAKLSFFDLIVDLQANPLLDFEMPPFGYYAPRGDEAKLQQALAELPTLVGQFEKAKFFFYNPEICAHGSSKLLGCTRCLDACPAGAITSLIEQGEKIAVDPYLCQGGGSCATACPTGAIIYSYPQPADMLNRLRVLLRRYREAGASDPLLLFHDSAAGSAWLGSHSEALPATLIPIEVEELGSVGSDLWLSALAFGARQVLLLKTAQVSARVQRELEVQLGFAGAILAGMGFPTDAVRLIDPIDPWPDTDTVMPDFEPAGFAGSNDKRGTLFFAIDWLYKHAPQPRAIIELPAQAPFGGIQVDKNACTLCMACVSVCPAAALAAGGDTPRLDFIEANCVQCGLCASACPEDAVALMPRFVYEREQRLRTRTLNEESPFCCIACGKPFATRSVIDKMLAKLAGHWMFQDDKARRRLQMCGDCRVKDLFEDENATSLR